MKYNDKKSKENDKKNIEKSHDIHSQECEVGEDTTKYGEFISSYFAWVPLPEQKENTERLENISKERKKEKKRE